MQLKTFFCSEKLWAEEVRLRQGGWDGQGPGRARLPAADGKGDDCDRDCGGDFVGHAGDECDWDGGEFDGDAGDDQYDGYGDSSSIWQKLEYSFIKISIFFRYTRGSRRRRWTLRLWIGSIRLRFRSRWGTACLFVYIFVCYGIVFFMLLFVCVCTLCLFGSIIFRNQEAERNHMSISGNRFKAYFYIRKRREGRGSWLQGFVHLLRPRSTGCK